MTTKNRWVYLCDMHNQTTIQNLTTGQTQTIYAAQVKDGAPIGLRGYVLEVDNGMYVETGELLHPVDEELFDQYIAFYRQANHWNYDYPHWEFESNVTPEQLATLKGKLEAMMAPRGLKFEVVGLAPRSLLYFTDGDYHTQKKFIAMVPRPNAVPWRRDGSLKERYRGTWSSLDRDNGVEYPKDYDKKVGGLTPMLYCGPAAVVRFKVEDQQPAFEHCRVYVTMDGDFICSDWCQRHDFSSYGGGINLQTGIYSFDSWIVGPCLSRAIQQKAFKPKGAKVTVAPVRELLKKAPPPMQSMQEALADAKKIVASTAPATNLLKARVASAVLAAAPDTTDAAIVEQILSEYSALLADVTNTGEVLSGVPILVPKHQFYISNKATAQPFEADPSTYRFTVAPKGCGASLSAGKVCVKPTPMVHQHLYFTNVTLDVVTLRKQLTAFVDELRVPPPSLVDAPPITADAIAEAKAIIAKQQEDRLAQERLELLATNVVKAEQLGPVEVLPNVLPSVQPMVATHDGLYGTATVKRITDEVVQVVWVTGPFADSDQPRLVRRTPDGLLSVDTVDSQEGFTLPDDAPNAIEADWYFNTFLPTQLKVQKALMANAMEVTVYTDSFRCYPVVGGATICKVVDGAVIEAVTVRQQANGHIYQVRENGKTTVLPHSAAKLAAQQFFKYLPKSTPTLEPVAA